MAKISFKKVKLKKQQRKVEFTWDKILLLFLVGAFILFYIFMSVLNNVDVDSIGRAISEQEEGNPVQTADIRFAIEVTDAEHLDSEKKFISDITKEVKYLDNSWSKPVSDGEYVRVVFEQPLTPDRDIKVFSRILSGNPTIQVYEKDGNEIIATFDSLTSNDYNKILLTNLQNSQDSFDLKISGGSVEFDHIIDPSNIYLVNADAHASATGIPAVAEDGGKNIVRRDSNQLNAMWINAAGTDPVCSTSANGGATWAALASEAGTETGVAIATNGTGVIYTGMNAINGAGDVGYIYNVAGACDTAGAYADVGTQTTNFRPDVAFDGVHNLYGVCSIGSGGGSAGDVAFSYATPSATTTLTWTATDTSLAATTSTSCSIDVDDTGNVFIASNEGTSGIVVYNSSAGTFAAVTTVTAYSSQVNNMHLSIRGNETLITAIDTATSDLVVIHSSDGITYTNTTYAGTFLDPEGCVDANNNYHIAFVNGSVLSYIRYTTNGFDNYEDFADSGTERYTSVRCTNFPSNNRLDSNDLELVFTDTGTNIYFANITIDTSAPATPPKWFDNSTNSTEAGEAVEHRVRWTDNTALSGYIFEFDNGTGSFLNDSFVSMIGTNNWSNVTKVINNTEGSTIRWRVYANDSSNNFNNTEIFTYTTTGDNPPKWQNVFVDDSTPNPTQTVTHSVNWTDDTALSFAYLEINSTGASCNTLANITSKAISGTINQTNLTWTVENACEGKLIGWRQWANDSANQWNVTSLQTYTVNNVNPTASFGTNPIDALNSSSNSITFEFKVSDNLDVDALRLYGNWTGSWAANQTNMTAINDSYWNVTVTGIPDGRNHVWAGWGNDTVGNFDFTDTNRTFTVDTAGPTVTLPVYTNGTVKKNIDPLILNISVTDATTTPQTCLVDVTGTNQTIAFSGGWCNGTISLTGLSDGDQVLKVWANDSVNNFGLNNSYVVRIDSTNPVVTLPVYTNATKKKSSDSLILNISVIDATTTPQTCLINVAGQGSNTTIAFSGGWCNGTISLTGSSQGNSTINAYANDSAGNFGLNNSYVVWIDDTAPVVTLPVYTNATKLRNTDSLIFNISVSDSGVGASYCAVNVAGNSNQTVAVSSGWCNGTYALTGISDGNQTINAYANDTVGNLALNNSYVVWVDSTAPVVTLPVYTNATIRRNDQLVILNISVTDSGVGVDRCTINVATSSTGNITVIPSSGWCNTTYSLAGASDGNQTINAYANDTVGNLALNNSYVVQMDSTSPNSTINAPSNNSLITDNTPDINITMTDNIDSLITYNVYVNGAINKTGSIANNSATNVTLDAQADGLKLIIAEAVDDAGNRFNSSTLFLTIDSSAPTMNYVSPTENSGVFRSRNYIQINVTATDSNLDKILIRLYNSSVIQINSSITSTSPNFINFTSLADGIYYYNATANDTLGNTANLETRNITLDTVKPNVQFVSPTTAAGNYSGNYIEANVTASDTNLDKIVIRIYNSTGLVNSSTNTTSPHFFNFTGLIDGTYFLNATANDTVGNENQTETRTILLDTTNPLIQFVAPTEANASSRSRTWIFANVTITETNFKNVTFKLFNSTGLLNETTYTTLVTTINWTNLDNSGVLYWYNASTFDQTSNSNSTETRYITLTQDQPPTVTILYPQNITYNVNVSDLNYTAEDDISLSACWYSLNGGANSTPDPAPCANFSGLTSNEGSNTWTVYANDSLNQVGSDIVFFTKDTINPNIQFVSNTETSGTFKSTNSINVNVTASDATLDKIVIRLYNSTSNEIRNNISSTSPFNITYLGLADGIYYFNSTANDTSGNSNSTETRNVTIDTTNPLIDYTTGTPANNANLSQNYIFVNVTWTETNFANVTYRLFNTTGQVNITTYTTEIKNINWTSLPNGAYTYNATIVDKASNSNTTTTRTVTLDTVKPNVQFVSPTTAAGNYSRNYIEANVTASDSGTGLSTIKIFLYNSSGLVSSSSNTTSPHFFNFTGLADGTYFLNATANDTANNENQTETRTITLDITKPNVQFVANTETSGSYKSTNSINVNVTATDTNLDKIVIRLYNSTSNEIRNNISSTSPFNITYLGLADGIYYFNSTANDTATNSNSTETRNVTIDTVFPQFTNFQRNPTTPNEDQSVQVNVTVTETNKDKVVLEFNNGTARNYSITTNNGDEFFFTINTGNYTAHDNVNYSWYANDTAGNMNKSALQSFTVANQAPSVSAPAINDTTPETDDLISCNGGIFSDNDAEDTEQNRFFLWYDNDVGISGQTSQTLNLTVSGLNKGDVIKCSARVYDGFDNSSFVNSSNTATIQNSPPVITNPLTSISWNANGSTFTYDYQYTDADGDGETWYDNTTLFDINGTGYISDTPTESEAGNYAIRINVSDGTINATDDFAYTINDVTSPQIQFVANTETSGSYKSTNTINVNVTATDASLDKIVIRLFNSTNNEIRTNLSSTSPFNITYTGLADGIYYFNSTANDTATNSNSTETRNVTIDTVNPLIDYTTGTPANNANLSQTYIFVNVTWTETNFANVTYRLFNSTSQVNVTTYTTEIKNINFTSLPDGVYTYNVTIVDKASNTNSTATRTVTLDTVKPNVQFVAPTTAAGNYSRNYIEANVTASDSGTGLSTIRIFLYNSSGLVSSSSNTTSPHFFNFTGLVDGTYFLNATANDTVRNENQTETRTITLDTGAPSIQFVSNTEASGSYKSTNSINVNVTASDATLDKIVIRLYNSTSNEIRNNVSSTSPFNITYSSLADGIYYFNSTANDTTGNANSTETRNVTIDTTFPQFTNFQRAPDPPNEDQSVQVNVTVTETNKDKVILEFNNGTARNYSITTSNGDEFFFTINTGNYTAHDNVNYSWYANDTAGNMNKSVLQSFTVANQAPTVSAPAINDTTPETNDLISCNGGTFSDNDAEDTEQNRYFLWYDNDVEISGQTSQTLNLTVSGLNKGDVIKCSARVYDGFDNSSFVNSSNTATIQNSAPVITNPLTSISWNANGSTFTYDYQYTDADGDGETWYDNTTLFDINGTGYISDTPTESEAGNYAIRINVSDGTVNTTDDFTYTINDVTSPQIQFVAPTETNGSQLTRNYIQVNVTASDGVAIGTITLRLYNSTSLVQTNTSTSSPLFVNFTGLPDEFYFFNATVNDTSGNINQTETRTVSTDTGAPTINYVAPTETNNTYLGRNYIQINVTAGDPNLDKILVRLYNSSNIQINSSTTSTSPNFINFTSLADGQYLFNATANDTFGNAASLGTRNVTLDTTKPSITNIAEIPSDPATYVSGATYRFNATITDTNLDKVLIEFDGTNYTPSNTFGGGIYNFTISDLAAGVHNYYWFANDSAANANTSVQTYTINNATGNVTLLINGSASNQTAVYGTQTNASASTLFGSVTLYRNGTDVTSQNNVFVTLAANYYNYTAVSTGDQNHSSASTTLFVTISKGQSVVNLTLNSTDGNVTIIQDSSIFLNVTTITGDSGATLKLYNAGTLINQGTSPLSNLTTFNTVGVFNITGLYIESENYTGGFETWYVNVTEIPDTTAPSVTNLTESPSDPATYSPGATYEFNATVTDNRGVSVVRIDFNGTNYTATNLSANLYNFTISDLAVGTYTYRWYANDTVGNMNSTMNGTYTINKNTTNLTLTITPSTSVTYPTETTATGSNCPSQLTCTLYRNGVDVGSSTDVKTLAAATYNYTYNTTGNANYTSDSETTNLTVNKGTGSVFTYLNNSRANITIEQQTAVYLNGTLETGIGDIKLYNNGTLINQGSSPLSNLTNFTTIGLFNITTQYDGNENYTSAFETWYVNVTELDVTPPQISILHPQNISYNSARTQLNYSASDNVALDKCWYSTNLGVTNTTITCGTNVTGLNSGEGSSTWRVYANDTRGNQNSSSVTFFVDTEIPDIQFVSPTEANGASLGRNYIQVNVTATDEDLDTITIRLYNSSNNLIRENLSSLSPFFINYTGLSEGNYSFNATANDTAGNQVSTETRSVSLARPSLAILRPENETYFNNISLQLNFSVSLQDLIVYNIDNTTNSTITGNTTFNTTSGQHTLYLFANNTLGTTSKNVTFTVNISTFKVIYDNYKSNGSSTDFNISSYEDIQNLSGIIIERTNHGKISFNEAINLTNDSNPGDNILDLDSNTNISENHIEINTTAIPNFNKSATLSLYNLDFTDPRVLRDGEVCPSDTCTEVNYSGGTFIFNVTQFTNYSAEETPGVAQPPSGGGGEVAVGGGIRQCLNNSNCGENENCIDGFCVKLFDIKIIDFESPAKLGEFFDFTYFIKAVANIDNDVVVSFWIEKGGEKISSGSDTIYLGSFDEKTEASKIFLPSSFESGIYSFVIEVSYQGYYARSQRTIEIQVKEGKITITPVDIGGIRTFIIAFLILLAVIAFTWIVYRERKKIKRGIEHGFVQESRFVKRYQSSILTFLLIVIAGLILYLAGFYEFLALKVSEAILLFKIYSKYVYYALSGLILLAILAIIFRSRGAKEKFHELGEWRKRRSIKSFFERKYSAGVREAEKIISRVEEIPEKKTALKSRLFSRAPFFSQKLERDTSELAKEARAIERGAEIIGKGLTKEVKVIGKDIKLIGRKFGGEVEKTERGILKAASEIEEIGKKTREAVKVPEKDVLGFFSVFGHDLKKFSEKIGRGFKRAGRLFRRETREIPRELKGAGHPVLKEKREVGEERTRLVQRSGEMIDEVYNDVAGLLSKAFGKRTRKITAEEFEEHFKKNDEKIAKRHRETFKDIVRLKEAFAKEKIAGISTEFEREIHRVRKGAAALVNDMLEHLEDNKLFSSEKERRRFEERGKKYGQDMSFVKRISRKSLRKTGLILKKSDNAIYRAYDSIRMGIKGLFKRDKRVERFKNPFDIPGNEKKNVRRPW